MAGGSINSVEATKHCERYIVEQNLWKRLPELKEAKCSVSLCFFNNGSTLYCFGGLTKSAGSDFTPCNTIERLSKGQNSWSILDLKLPHPRFDVGSMQVNHSQIMVFGGFSEAPASEVWIYSNENPKEEGEFTRGEPLPKPDFFITNGVYMEVPEAVQEHAQEPERVIMGMHSILSLNMTRKSFQSLPFSE